MHAAHSLLEVLLRLALYDRNSKKGGLMSQYVNCFLKFKQEASGWPESCDSEVKKQKFIEDYERVEGIRLEVTNLQFEVSGSW